MSSAILELRDFISKGTSLKFPLRWWQFGGSPSGVYGAGSGIGKVSVTEITITRDGDRYSSSLFEAAATGKIISQMRISQVFKNDAQVTIKMQIVFTDVMISQMSSTGGDEQVETITFNFTKYEMSK